MTEQIPNDPFRLARDARELIMLEWGRLANPDNGYPHASSELARKVFRIVKAKYGRALSDRTLKRYVRDITNERVFDDD